MNQCEGKGRPLTAQQLQRCTYDAMTDDRYCFYHRGVVDGRITEIQYAQEGKSWRPSWQPRKDRPPSQARRPLDVLLDQAEGL